MKKGKAKDRRLRDREALRLAELLFSHGREMGAWPKSDPVSPFKNQLKRHD